MEAELPSNNSMIPVVFSKQIWEGVLSDIRQTLGEGCFRSWFSQIVPLQFQNGILTLQTDRGLVRDRLLAQYSGDLLEALKKRVPDVENFEITLSSDPLPAPSSPNESSLDERFTFDTFVVGKPNEFAYAAAQQVANTDQPHFNPLFLYGGVGLGKTHLMHATAWQIQKNNKNRRILYLSAEQFMYQFIRSLRFKNTLEFKEQFRSVDVLMIDDFQFIGGKETTQEEFFHTFNSLIENRKQIVISADKSPADLENIGDRLKSRLGWGLVADIHPTTYELRLGILQSKVEKLSMPIGLDILEFLAARIKSNVRELEGALNRIIAHASLIGRAITLESTQEVLKDVIRSHEKYVTIEDIQKKTCDFFGIKLSDLLSAKRSKFFVKPRQVAMYLCKTLTTKSFPEIGKQFGGRDHTTVIHAIKKVQEFCNQDASLLHDIEVLRSILSA